MTISSTTVRNSYSGNGSTTVFAYTFKILDDDEIQVIIRSSTGTETIKTKTTHYTVSGVGVAGGGNITFLTAPGSTETVVLKRNTTKTQETDYVANDPFPANSHEEALDRVTMIAQEIQEELGRAIKLSKTNTMTSTEFTVGAADRANKILAFDGNGEISVTQELGTYRGNWATATSYNARDLVKDTSTGNIFIVDTAHTSSGSQPLTTNANSAYYELIVDNASASANANAASNSASNSSNFANNASNSANAASNHSSNASNHASNASNSANSSSNHSSNASNSANSSANFSSNSSNFANNSSNSANSASNHSSNSSNFANNSSNSANDSANHASNSSNFANNSSNSANTSANHASNSSNFANNSSNHASNSSNHASNSSNHASNSSNHSANSSNFANNSSNHSSNSSNFANNASNHSSNAANHASNAANSAAAAAASAETFDDVYLGSKANDPTVDNDGDPLTAGDLYYNSTSGNLKYYTGSAWIAVTSGGISDLVQDTSPQLGGNLDVNTYSITSTSNGNITLQPNGTGDVVLSADTVKIGDTNTDAILTTDGTSDITISTNSGTNSGTVKIFDGANGNIEITPNGTGVVKLDGLSYPTADGSAGQALVTNGSGVLSFATAGIAWQSVQTSGFTAVAGRGYPCNTTSSAFTVTLPASPSAGDTIILVDYAGTFDTNTLTINPNGNKIEGATSNLRLTGEREGATLTYIDATQGWIASSGINEGTDALSPLSYSVDFLVVAGGAGGGSGNGSGGGGGGGAGGYRTSTQTVNGGTVITVTVGDGGAGGIAPYTNDDAVAGSNSSISGSGLTTITSAGGGKGGAAIANGGNGGSGGGGGYVPSTGGNGNTPSTSPSQGNNGGNSGSVRGGGGGGGSSAVGASVAGDGYAVPGGAGGAGGAGTANSITGSSVTRAGGGGGGAYGTGGSGGSGGGGAGGGASTNGSNSSPANSGSGGGGGGGAANTDGGSGSKGVVILSMPDANYTGTTTGSPTVATGVSGKTVLTFNGSGSYTA
jgi:hypothetical protein